MKVIYLICFLVGFLAFSNEGFAQKEVEISGVKYILHKVEKSETVFSLCQKYKVTPSDLQKANPGINAVLAVGSEVRIPVSVKKADVVAKTTENQPRKENNSEFYYHKVGKKQTIFSIAKQYDVTANDLIRNNPDLTNGLKMGQVLKIPVNVTRPNTGIISESVEMPAPPKNKSEFIIHQVVSGETLFGLAQKYGSSQQAILSANPEIQEGLKAGMKLNIPANQVSPSNEPVHDPKSYIKYKVEKGETLFSLSNRFGIEVSEIKRLNPLLLSRSLETGEIIIIPNQGLKKNENNLEMTDQTAFSEENWSASSGNCQPLSGNIHQKYKVGLLLPFYLPKLRSSDLQSDKLSRLVEKINFTAHYDTLSADTAAVVNGPTISPKALGFLDFYEGALLAIDSLQELGMNIELYTFDASDKEMITRLLQMEEFMDLNLIIGPVYPELQESVASFAAKNRIPMVSPLSSTGTFENNNSWYFKVNPTKEYQIEQTALYLATAFPGKNKFLLSGKSGSSDAQLANLCREKLSSGPESRFFHEYSFQKKGVNDIKHLLNENEENIFIIPSENEAEVSIAVTNLTALAEHYNIVLVGTSALPKLKSIQTENYHRVRLRFLSPYFVDYTKPLVKRVTSSYREIFSEEPSPYSFQGFDVSFYFLSALYRYGKDFRECLTSYPMELTQMDFGFRKVSTLGGSMNKSLFVTSFERNYDVSKQGVSGN